MFMVGLVVPSNDPNLLLSTGNASQSPFVIAARRAGIKVVPSIINTVVLTSAWSAGNSGVLGGSRVLYSLALDGKAPKIFTRINRYGIPYVAVSLFGLFMALAYMTVSSGASNVFSWLSSLVAVATLTNWIVITVTYLRLFYGLQKQGVSRHERMPWASPFQPYLSWYALFLELLILLTGGYATFINGEWSTKTFVSAYVNIPLFLALYTGHKVAKKTKAVSLVDMPIERLLQIYEASPGEKPAPPKGLARLNFLWN